VTAPLRALAVAAGAGLLFAACSNSGSPNAQSSTTTTHSTTTSTTAAASTPTTAATSTSTTAAQTACSHITASAGQAQGAAGTITGVVTVTNAGSAACVVDGYPTMALYSGSGAPLTVTMVNGLSVSLTPPANAAPSTVTVAPSATAQFAYQYSDVPVGSETSCPTSESASATMPGATAGSASFALAIAPCNNGTIRVSPVYQPS
jgi:Protein of unknown function (DUF4232)